MGLFSRRPVPAPADYGLGLGSTRVALRLAAGSVAPAATTLVIFNRAGQARRLAAGRVVCGQEDVAYAFHPGPYSVDLLPFAAAPEIGLRLRFVIDSANPRTVQQRFDLYLFSEAAAGLSLSALGQALELALQAELAQGGLDLPPCTSIEEWHRFRAGLNQLFYTRFGITVDDCVPVDLGEHTDYAALLRQRAALAEAAPPDCPQAPATARAAAAADTAAAVADTAAAAPATAAGDAPALRRLFLELPALSSALRLLVLPPGLACFQSHQVLLQRIGLQALAASSMPALAWAAPDQPLAPPQQARRAAHSTLASLALDEGWALLARLQLASAAQWPALLDEADRLCANLEFHLGQRRLAHVSEQRQELAP